MPPSAAAIGSAARRSSRSSPTTISRLTSSPTTKKKIAIRPSLTQWRSECTKSTGPNRRPTGVFQKARNGSAAGELARARAAAVTASSAIPLVDSTCRKRAMGSTMRWTGRVGRHTPGAMQVGSSIRKGLRQTRVAASYRSRPAWDFSNRGRPSVMS